jgi:hypothetical protein
MIYRENAGDDLDELRGRASFAEKKMDRLMRTNKRLLRLLQVVGCIAAFSSGFVLADFMSFHEPASSISNELEKFSQKELNRQVIDKAEWVLVEIGESIKNHEIEVNKKIKYRAQTKTIDKAGKEWMKGYGVTGTFLCWYGSDDIHYNETQCEIKRKYKPILNVYCRLDTEECYCSGDTCRIK